MEIDEELRSGTCSASRLNLIPTDTSEKTRTSFWYRLFNFTSVSRIFFNGDCSSRLFSVLQQNDDGPVGTSTLFRKREYEIYNISLTSLRIFAHPLTRRISVRLVLNYSHKLIIQTHLDRIRCRFSCQLKEMKFEADMTRGWVVENFILNFETKLTRLTCLERRVRPCVVQFAPVYYRWFYQYILLSTLYDL